MRLVFLFELGEVHLWIVLSQIFHPSLLLLAFELLLFALLESLFLVDLEFFVFYFFGGELVVWDVYEVELVFLAFLLYQAEF